MSPTERQRRLLEAEDGRYFAIDYVGTGVGSIATTERVGPVNVGLGLPSGLALFLSLAHQAFIAYRDVEPLQYFDRHPQGVWPDDSRPLFDFFERFAAHVVFSFPALESFANETTPRGHEYTTIDRTTKQKVTYSQEEAERYVSLDEKLSELLPGALKVDSPKGSHHWRNFKNLKKFRDRIIHLKSVDKQPSGPETKTIWGDMLRNTKRPYCDEVHALMGCYGPAATDRRWYKKYPYTKA